MEMLRDYDNEDGGGGVAGQLFTASCIKGIFLLFCKAMLSYIPIQGMCAHS